MFFDVRHFLSAALSLVRCPQRSSDNQGLEGVAHAGLEEIMSKEEAKVEHKVSVEVFTSRDANFVGEMTRQRKDGREKVSGGFV